MYLERKTEEFLGIACLGISITNFKNRSFSLGQGVVQSEPNLE